MPLLPRPEARLAEYALSRGVGPAARAWLSRPRPGTGGDLRADVYYACNRISYAQVFPYIHHAPELRRAHGVSLRFHPVEPVLEGRARPRAGADLILVQTWFTVEDGALRRLMDALAARNPGATVAYLDSFAHNDLRLARVLEPYLDFYLKKSLFRDRGAYFVAWEGDTNLTQFYGRRHGLDQAPVDWETPRAILPKLRLSPNFFTAPHFLRRFAEGPPPPEGERPIDLHARLGGTAGDTPYSHMRRDALARAQALAASGLEVPVGPVEWRAYMDEMRRSKLCFSPFGYGELCWRDVEAFLTGAVLVKPDMSHLETLPDLYEPGATYLPTRWDMEDLDEVVRGALADPDRLRRIARAAFDRVADYLRAGRFAADSAFLFDSARRNA